MATRRKDLYYYIRKYRRYRRQGIKAIRFTWKHRWLASSLTLGVVTGVYSGRWLEISGPTQVIVSLVTIALCAAVWVFLNVGYGAIYVVRGLHPLTGTYCVLYVGLTERPPWTDRDGDLRHTRIDEHIFGSNRYNKPCLPKVWADTVVDYYIAHE